jgi:hypothetical protein
MRKTGGIRKDGGRLQGGSVMAGKAIKHLIALIAIACLIGAVLGRSCVAVKIACDISDSRTPEERKRDYGPVEVFLGSVLRCPISFYAFDRGVTKPYEGEPDRVQDVWDLIDETITARTGVKGTYPGLCLRTILADVKSSGDSNRPFSIILMWDGEMFDPEVVREAAEGLAQMKSFRGMWIVGVERNDRLKVEGVLSALKERGLLSVSCEDDAGPGMERFKKIMRKGR